MSVTRMFQTRPCPGSSYLERCPSLEGKIRRNTMGLALGVAGWMSDMGQELTLVRLYTRRFSGM